MNNEEDLSIFDPHLFTPRLYPTGQRMRWSWDFECVRDRGVYPDPFTAPDGKQYRIVRAPCRLPTCYCDAIAVPIELTLGLSDLEIVAKFVGGS